MKKLALAFAAPPLLAAAPAPPPEKKPAPAPSEIVAAAPAADWVAIVASDLLVMELAADAKGKPRRVIIQLMPPPFSQGWIGNIRKLAAAHWWDGTAIVRVQDNYVTQWGDPDGDDSAAISNDELEEVVSQRVKIYSQAHPRARPKEIDLVTRGFRQAVMNEQIEKASSSKAKKLPEGLVTMSESQYLVVRPQREYVAAGHVEYDAEPRIRELHHQDGILYSDPYGRVDVGFAAGWPVGYEGYGQPEMWPVHCYGMVGVGRNMSPDTGTGAELYTVIGHAPRHLDRNVALVGRVIEGIEHLSSLPRGTGPLGFYEKAEERVPILSIRMGTEVKDVPAFQYLSTDSKSFAAYADARANRRDPFFNVPAGGADICNIPVPVRRAPK